MREARDFGEAEAVAADGLIERRRTNLDSLVDAAIMLPSRPQGELQ